MNPHRGDNLITIDGREWKFRFTINDLAELEGVLGHPLVTADWNSVVEVRKVIHYMLHKENEKVSVSRAGVMIDNTIAAGTRFPDLAEQVANAVFECLTGPDDGSEEGDDTPVEKLDGTGEDG